MAHFAKLDENNIVIEVIVVNNLELDADNEESSGLAWLENWSGGYTNWKQTSYNRNFRKNYAGIGDTYDPIRDAFIPQKPDDFVDEEGNSFTFVLDEETCQWDKVNK
jgi:hypothetical protein